jgi:hypothetical protein
LSCFLRFFTLFLPILGYFEVFGAVFYLKFAYFWLFLAVFMVFCHKFANFELF